MDIAATDTLDFGKVVNRAKRTIRMTGVMLGFLTWFAITATTWVCLFLLDNLMDLPTALRFPFAIVGLVVTVGAFLKCVVGSLRAEPEQRAGRAHAGEAIRDRGECPDQYDAV